MESIRGGTCPAPPSETRRGHTGRSTGVCARRGGIPAPSSGSTGCTEQAVAPRRRGSCRGLCCTSRAACPSRGRHTGGGDGGDREAPAQRAHLGNHRPPATALGVCLNAGSACLRLSTRWLLSLFILFFLPPAGSPLREAKRGAGLARAAGSRAWRAAASPPSGAPGGSVQGSGRGGGDVAFIPQVQGSEGLESGLLHPSKPRLKQHEWPEYK